MLLADVQPEATSADAVSTLNDYYRRDFALPASPIPPADQAAKDKQVAEARTADEAEGIHPPRGGRRPAVWVEADRSKCGHAALLRNLEQLLEVAELFNGAVDGQFDIGLLSAELLEEDKVSFAPRNDLQGVGVIS